MQALLIWVCGEIFPFRFSLCDNNRSLCFWCVGFGWRTFYFGGKYGIGRAEGRDRSSGTDSHPQKGEGAVRHGWRGWAGVDAGGGMPAQPPLCADCPGRGNVKNSAWNIWPLGGQIWRFNHFRNSKKIKKYSKNKEFDLAKGSEKGLSASKIPNTAKNIPKTKILCTAYTLFTKKWKKLQKGVDKAAFVCYTCHNKSRDRKSVSKGHHAQRAAGWCKAVALRLWIHSASCGLKDLRVGFTGCDRYIVRV